MRWQDLLSLVNRQEVQLSESRQLSSEFLEQQRRLRDAEDELQAAHKTNKDLQVLTHTHTYTYKHTNSSYSLPLPAQDRLSAAEREAAERDLEARRWKLTAEEAALQVRSTNTRAPEKDSSTLTQSALARELKRAQADLTEAQYDRKALDQELGEEPYLTRPDLI